MEKKNSHACRVCLKSDTTEQEMLYVFEEYKGKYINDKINYIVDIDIKQGDGLPDKICLPCVQSLETAYSFKRTCEESNNILQPVLLLLRECEKIEVKGETQENEDYFDNEVTSPVEFDSGDVKIEYEYKKFDEKDYHETDSQLIGEVTEQSHHPSKAIDLHLECHDCGGFFKSKCKLSVHWKREHMPTQLICPNCKKTCKSYKALHSHIKQKTKQCLFASKLKIKGIGKSRIFHCSECDYSAKTAEYVMKHYVQHSGEKHYSCELCGKSYTQSSSLINHKERSHKIKIIEKTCDLCGKRVIGRANIYRHKMSHKSSNQYPCEICKKVLQSKAILKIHMKRHSNVKGESCDICQKTFYTRSEVINHRRNVHIKSKLYKCDRCSFESRSYDSVSKHKKKHTDTNVPCGICWKFVENEQQLKVHMLRHDKKIQCMYCGTMFLCQKYHNAHLRKKHGIRQGSNKNMKGKTAARNLLLQTENVSGVES